MKTYGLIQKELVRKFIHISGIAYIFIITSFGREITFAVVVILTIVAILFELVGRKHYSSIDILLRDYEKTRIPGYVYTGIAFSLITPLFSINACIMSAITAFIGDGVAGIVKRVKKLLGIPAFIIPSFLASLMFHFDPVISIMAISFASLFDGRRLEDNLTIPIVTAIIYDLLILLF